MTAATTTIDAAKLQAVQDTLQEAIKELERLVFTARDARRNRVSANAVEAVAEDLSDALDSLQIGSGTPYVWVLTERWRFAKGNPS